MKEKICKCGGKLKPNLTLTDGFIVGCMKCDNCNDILFTPEQAKELIKLRDINKEIEGKRKIVKVGSSIACFITKKSRGIWH